jgi:hypothetical protein
MRNYWLVARMSAPEGTMDAKMKQLDDAVATVTENLSWDQWEMDAPTYTQAGHTVEKSPGARDFHRTDGHGSRDGSEIRIHHFWNGSASFHPEQPTEWPGVTVRAMLPAGRYDLQLKLAEKFRQAIEEVLNRD